MPHHSLNDVQSPFALVIGALNLDIVIKGLPKFADPNEQVNGSEIQLNPGGKGRNIAAMLAAWLAPGQVAMLSQLIQDKYGLFRIPLESLQDAHINTDYVQLLTDRPDDLPTLAIFLNTTDHQRANYYLPGENETLSPETIDLAEPLFKHLAEQDGFLLLTLEMPIQTACHALALAKKYHLNVMLDPGGQPPEIEIDYAPLFDYPIFLIKPNHEEAERICGIRMNDFSSAQMAAEKLMDMGASHILITHGAQGAYAFTQNVARHFPPPDFPVPPHAESTGCGDQVLAVVCAEMLHGSSFLAACQKAVRAGSLQFIQPGLMPIPPEHPGLVNQG